MASGAWAALVRCRSIGGGLGRVSRVTSPDAPAGALPFLRPGCRQVRVDLEHGWCPEALEVFGRPDRRIEPGCEDETGHHEGEARADAHSQVHQALLQGLDWLVGHDRLVQDLELRLLG